MKFKRFNIPAGILILASISLSQTATFSQDITIVGQLLGEKIIMNEMIGYISLKDLIAAGAFADQKSIIMATYILCGFANFSSVGIQIGGIGALAPSQRPMLARLGFLALLGGAMSSLLSAALVGMILG